MRNTDRRIHLQSNSYKLGPVTIALNMDTAMNPKLQPKTENIDISENIFIYRVLLVNNNLNASTIQVFSISYALNSLFLGDSGYFAKKKVKKL